MSPHGGISCGAIVPTAVVAFLPGLRARLSWPLQRFEATYFGPGLALLVGAIAVWTVLSCLQLGDTAPLPYVPIVNPLELTQLFVLFTTFSWLQPNYLAMSDKARWYSWSALAFLVLNNIIARSTHVFADVPFSFSALWHSATYQTAVSIIWTLTALFIMVIATRLKQRTTWIIGSTLLGAVVIKLFLVDLADIGTIARIVSFIVVGLLILLIGYLSPLPPRVKEQS